VLRLFRAADADRDGELCCEEFVQVVAQAVPQWTREEVRPLRSFALRVRELAQGAGVRRLTSRRV